MGFKIWGISLFICTCLFGLTVSAQTPYVMISGEAWKLWGEKKSQTTPAFSAAAFWGKSSIKPGITFSTGVLFGKNNSTTDKTITQASSQSTHTRCLSLGFAILKRWEISSNLHPYLMGKISVLRYLPEDVSGNDLRLKLPIADRYGTLTPLLSVEPGIAYSLNPSWELGISTGLGITGTDFLDNQNSSKGKDWIYSLGINLGYYFPVKN